MKHSHWFHVCALCVISGMLFGSCIPKDAVTAPETEEETLTEAQPVTAQPSHTVITLNTEDFIRLVFDFRNASSWEYKGELPCVIDFYADWCKPCQMMAPIMEKMAEEYQGRLVFYKVNVDENRELSDYFQIQGIPYFLFFPTKGEPLVKMGGMNEEEVRTKLEEIL